MTNEASSDLVDVLRAVAHDLNNPLAAMGMDLYLLRRAPEEADREAALANLERAVSDLRDIVDGLERRVAARASGERDQNA